MACLVSRQTIKNIGAAIKWNYQNKRSLSQTHILKFRPHFLDAPACLNKSRNFLYQQTNYILRSSTALSTVSRTQIKRTLSRIYTPSLFVHIYTHRYTPLLLNCNTNSRRYKNDNNTTCSRAVSTEGNATHCHFSTLVFFKVQHKALEYI